MIRDFLIALAITGVIVAANLLWNSRNARDECGGRFVVYYQSCPYR